MRRSFIANAGWADGKSKGKNASILSPATTTERSYLRASRFTSRGEAEIETKRGAVCQGLGDTLARQHCVLSRHRISLVGLAIPDRYNQCGMLLHDCFEMCCIGVVLLE